MRAAAETIAALGERVAAAALATPALLRSARLTGAEDAARADRSRLRTAPARHHGSTRSCCRPRLHFAEYNAESPAGLGYTQRLCELFDAMPAMSRFRDGTTRPVQRARLNRCWTRCSRAIANGAAAPIRRTIAIVDWREVPTWTEFEILRDAFVAARRADGRLRSARSDVRRKRARCVAATDASIMVYRRVLINDIVAQAGRMRARSLQAYEEARRLRGEHISMQAARTRKHSLPCLTDDPKRTRSSPTAEREAIARARAVDQAGGATRRPSRTAAESVCCDSPRTERETLVLKPNDEYGGTGVMLGWETAPRRLEQPP